jgi:hypothetical protein
MDEHAKNGESKEKIIDSVYVTSYREDAGFRTDDFSKPKK